MGHRRVRYKAWPHHFPQFHDKARIKETQAINSSLMTLKQCIKNRAKSVQEPNTFVHIPFRYVVFPFLLLMCNLSLSLNRLFQASQTDAGDEGSL